MKRKLLFPKFGVNEEGGGDSSRTCMGGADKTMKVIYPSLGTPLLLKKQDCNKIELLVVASKEEKEDIEGKYLFSVDIKYMIPLNNNQVSSELKEKFKKENIDLSNASVEMKENNFEWLIKDKKKYTVKKEKNRLNIYERKISPEILLTPANQPNIPGIRIPVNSFKELTWDSKEEIGQNQFRFLITNKERKDFFYPNNFIYKFTCTFDNKLISNIPNLSRCLFNLHFFPYGVAKPDGGWQEIFHSVFIADNFTGNFVHLSDIHIARRNDEIGEKIPRIFSEQYVNFNENFIQFIREINYLGGSKIGLLEKSDKPADMAKTRLLKQRFSEKIDFVILTGDIVDFILNNKEFPKNKHPSFQSSNWEIFRKLVLGEHPKQKEPLDIPIFTLPGNHDCRLFSYPLGELNSLNEYNLPAGGIGLKVPGLIDKIKAPLSLKTETIYLFPYIDSINPFLRYSFCPPEKDGILNTSFQQGNQRITAYSQFQKPRDQFVCLFSGEDTPIFPLWPLKSLPYGFWPMLWAFLGVYALVPWTLAFIFQKTFSGKAMQFSIPKISGFYGGCSGLEISSLYLVTGILFLLTLLSALYSKRILTYISLYLLVPLIPLSVFQMLNIYPNLFYSLVFYYILPSILIFFLYSFLKIREAIHRSPNSVGLAKEDLKFFDSFSFQGANIRSCWVASHSPLVTDIPQIIETEKWYEDLRKIWLWIEDFGYWLFSLRITLAALHWLWKIFSLGKINAWNECKFSMFRRSCGSMLYYRNKFLGICYKITRHSRTHVKLLSGHIHAHSKINFYREKFLCGDQYTIEKKKKGELFLVQLQSRAGGSVGFEVRSLKEKLETEDVDLVFCVKPDKKVIKPGYRIFKDDVPTDYELAEEEKFCKPLVFEPSVVGKFSLIIFVLFSLAFSILYLFYKDTKRDGFFRILRAGDDLRFKAQNLGDIRVYSQAIETYDRASEYDSWSIPIPSSEIAEIYYRQAQCYYQIKCYKEAEEAMLKCLKKQKGNNIYHYMMGSILLDYVRDEKNKNLLPDEKNKKLEDAYTNVLEAGNYRYSDYLLFRVLLEQLKTTKEKKEVKEQKVEKALQIIENCVKKLAVSPSKEAYTYFAAKAAFYYKHVQKVNTKEKRDAYIDALKAGGIEIDALPKLEFEKVNNKDFTFPPFSRFKVISSDWNVFTDSYTFKQEKERIYSYCYNLASLSSVLAVEDEPNSLENTEKALRYLQLLKLRQFRDILEDDLAKINLFYGDEDFCKNPHFQTIFTTYGGGRQFFNKFFERR